MQYSLEVWGTRNVNKRVQVSPEYRAAQFVRGTRDDTKLSLIQWEVHYNNNTAARLIKVSTAPRCSSNKCTGYMYNKTNSDTAAKPTLRLPRLTNVFELRIPAY